MNSFEQWRGKLLSSVTSLAFSFSAEFLKWQYPVSAAAEKLAFLAASFRVSALPSSSQPVRR